MAGTSQNDLEHNVELEFVLDEDEAQPTFVCRRCQCTSEFAAGFQKRNRRKSLPDQYTCITCLTYRSAKRTKRSAHLDTLFILCVIGLYAYSSGFGLVAAFIASWFLLQYAGIFLHEFGHYIANRMQGVNVGLVILGSGPVLTSFRLNQTLVVIKPYPFSGLVAAGPFLNLLMAAFTFVALNYYGMLISPVTQSLLTLWLVINVLLGTMNLIPFKSKTEVGLLQTDGAQLCCKPMALSC